MTENTKCQYCSHEITEKSFYGTVYNVCSNRNCESMRNVGLISQKIKDLKKVDGEQSVSIDRGVRI